MNHPPVVIDENKLCVVIGNDAQILMAKASSGLCADPLVATCPIPMDKSKMRPATLADFDEFRVCPEGHNVTI